MIEPSEDQKAALDAIADWYHNSPEQSYCLGGLAGTGKTTIAAAIPEFLGGVATAYCAYTGKAALVLSKRLGQKATTIHRLIYSPTEYKCGKYPKCGKHCRDCGVTFNRNEAFRDARPRLVVVDEASMVSREIYDDLMAFGVKVLWIGDHGQLPPVGRDSFNLMGDPDFRLERIHRQAEGSPILRLAMTAREQGVIPYGEVAEGVGKYRSTGKIDIDSDEWGSDLLMLCGYNRTRVGLNKAARSERGFTAPHPVPGDRVVCLRNNHDAGVFNGMLGTVLEVDTDDPYALGLTVQPDGDFPVYKGRAALEQFGSEKTLMGIPRRTDLWDYGYALTVHKAQGSEAERVIVFEEPFGTADDRRRWLYTAVTRAKSKLEIYGRG